MQPDRFRTARRIKRLAPDLDAGEAGSLIGEPVFDAGDVADMALTSDQWVAVLTARREAGRPLHAAEVRHG